MLKQVQKADIPERHYMQFYLPLPASSHPANVAGTQMVIPEGPQGTN